MKLATQTPARERRTAIARAARTWMNTDPTNAEADVALESVLLTHGVISLSEVIEAMWSDAPETVMIRLDSGTLIEIDVASGNHARGMHDE